MSLFGGGGRVSKSMLLFGAKFARCLLILVMRVSYTPFDADHLFLNSGQNMLRRKPTRVELTTDDVQDYEAIKKKAEDKKKQDDIERQRIKPQTKGTVVDGDYAAPNAVARREAVASRIGLRLP